MADTPRDFVTTLQYVTGTRGSRSTSPESDRERHAKSAHALLRDPNIVAVGISCKSVGRRLCEEIALSFYVEKKLPLSKVRRAWRVPPELALATSKPVLTDVKAIGTLAPEMSVHRRRTPISSGFSVGHFRGSTGTIGAIVKKGRNHFLLSNSHVLANSGRARLEDIVLYPGVVDGGKRHADQVAALAAFVPFAKGAAFVNRVDAALARLDNARLSEVDFAIAGLKMPISTIAPRRGMRVIKHGRTTGTTEGEVLDVDFHVVLRYPGVGRIGFVDQVLCTRYTKPGDSGALVLAKDTGAIVGMHFAGAKGGSVFNPIAQVLKALRFKFASS